MNNCNIKILLDNLKSIEMREGKMGGQPLLKDHRFSVAQLIAELAHGSKVKNIASDYCLDEELLINALDEVANIIGQLSDVCTLLKKLEHDNASLDYEIAIRAALERWIIKSCSPVKATEAWAYVEKQTVVEKKAALAIINKPI